LAALGAGTAVVVSSVGAVAGVSMVVPLVWVVPVVWAAIEDARSARLPDRVTMGGAGVVAAVLSVAAVVESSWSLVVHACVGGALLGGVLLVMHVASPRGLGFGDVKFGLLVGLGVGVVRPGLTLFVFLSAAVLHVVVAWGRPWPAQRVPQARGGVAPFGPSLAAASIGWVLVVLVWGGGV
jgi:leader peptidase (prepilin peptidase)/N-methyltransferase